MLYGEIIAVCSQIQTKHINKLCGQNVELLNVKLAVLGFKRWNKAIQMKSYDEIMAGPIMFHDPLLYLLVWLH